MKAIEQYLEMLERSWNGLESIIIKNNNFRDEVVKGWSRRNMPSIIQIRVDSKGLSKEFNFRE